MPFICSFCHDAFCPQHRLPESHDCPEYWRIQARKAPIFGAMAPPDIRAYAGVRVRPSRSALRFSPTEIKHVLLGTVLVSAVGISFFASGALWNWITMAAAVVFFTAGFIIHELAHKVVAQRYGMWAEFRLDRFGALLTIFSVVSPLKIIAPGAVVIAGETTPDRVGRTAVAGPSVNILLAAALFGLTRIFQPWALLDAMLAGAAINAFMALFNLVPFGVFDGLKVLKWSKPVWVCLFALSVLVTWLSYTSL